MYDYEKIIEKVKQRLIILGWSKYKLSKMANIPPSNLSLYFSLRAKIGLENFLRICEALKINPLDFKTERFVLEKAKLKEHYIVVDTINKVVVRFKEHQFNETQKITNLYDVDVSDFTKIANIEISEWLMENHQEIVF